MQSLSAISSVTHSRCNGSLSPTWVELLSTSYTLSSSSRGQLVSHTYDVKDYTNIKVTLWANEYYWKWCNFMVKGIDKDGNEIVLVNESGTYNTTSFKNNTFDISMFDELYVSVCPGALRDVGGSCWIKVDITNY